MSTDQKAYLLLANGTVFEGKAFGAKGETLGEIVFTTGMTGYLETLTDPSYFGQIVIQTFPLIGNYGVIPPDFESEKSHIKGYIVRDWCQFPSNFRSEGDIDTFLKSQGIVGLYDIDTRQLTKIIRESGVMNGIITMTDPRGNKDALLEIIRPYIVKDAVKSVTGRQIKNFSGIDHSTYKVVLYDFGYKHNILRCLLQRGCDVTVVPADMDAQTALAMHPDGIMLSNGPGDPAENVEIIEQLRILQKSGIPIFGICLGHQLLALANGASTQKLKYGHRGANQPVKNLQTGRVYITSQNHGYAVLNDTLPEDVGFISYVNANDGTCEGITYLNAPVFSVQFHPEACAGPLDTGFLFDEFLQLMKGGK